MKFDTFWGEIDHHSHILRRDRPLFTNSKERYNITFSGEIHHLSHILRRDRPPFTNSKEIYTTFDTIWGEIDHLLNMGDTLKDTQDR